MRSALDTNAYTVFQRGQSPDIELPIVGRVCMNHTMVDLGRTDLQVGHDRTAGSVRCEIVR